MKDEVDVCEDRTKSAMISRKSVLIESSGPTRSFSSDRIEVLGQGDWRYRHGRKDLDLDQPK